MLVPGSTVGNFRILFPLGEGGMGIVYAAEHVVLGTRSAIKVLHGEAARHPEIVQRFINEARAAAHLRHRNIISVHDCGQLADGQWYIALEFLDGSPLRRFIESHAGPIDPATIVHIIAEASNALHVAHAAGIVHRDVKPDNLFLTQTATDPHHVTVLDFGIAKLNEHEARVATRSGVAMGTPAYMAPEQLLDAKTVDPRSDVYALGVVAFEMSTGRRPWGDETNPVKLHREQSSGSIPDPRRILAERGLRVDLPDAWVEVVRRALDPDPDRRWPSTKEFALALAHATPGSAWTESGIDLVRRYAPELAQVGPEIDTVGRSVVLGEPQPVQRSTPMLSDPSTGAPRPAMPTTLGSASGESVVSRADGPRRWPAIVIAASAAAGVVLVLIATRSGDASKAGDTTRTATPTLDAAAAAVEVPVPDASSPAVAPTTVDAGVVVDTPPMTAQEPAEPRAGKPQPPTAKPKPRPRPSAKPTGESSEPARPAAKPTFSPDDVPGD
jgi:serine/threonine protein kinase